MGEGKNKKIHIIGELKVEFGEEVAQRGDEVRKSRKTLGN